MQDVRGQNESHGGRGVLDGQPPQGRQLVQAADEVVCPLLPLNVYFKTLDLAEGKRAVWRTGG